MGQFKLFQGRGALSLDPLYTTQRGLREEIITSNPSRINTYSMHLILDATKVRSAINREQG